MIDLLEPEEFIGRQWHRLVGRAHSWPRYPDAAIALDDVRQSLSVFFRGMGGEKSLGLAGTAASQSGHRLSFLQRLGQDEELLVRPRLDRNALYLPPKADLFPSPDLNRALYYWLAAFFSQAQSLPSSTDPLVRDLRFLQLVHRTTESVLSLCPGLVYLHRRMCAHLLAVRPKRPLPSFEQHVEDAVLRLLGAETDGGMFWPLVVSDVDVPPAPVKYKPFLPVPVWGEVDRREEVSKPGMVDEEVAGGGGADAKDGTVRKGVRQESDQMNREDSLILNRFEKILSMIQSLNINRDVDDDDEDNARKALDDADEIALSSRPGTPSTKLKFDLDLPPDALDLQRIQAELTYPEWHCEKKVYLPDYCNVLIGYASEEGEDWVPSEETEKLIKEVRRKFEAIRPRHEILKAQMDGFDFDMDALVRSRCDLVASGYGTDRIHLGQRRQARDLSVMILMDVSLSTDGWIENRRVLDVEKEALAVLANALEASGDALSILTFTSRRRNWVRMETVKDFDEPFGARPMRRLSALKPQFYTRIGPAVRHATHLLKERPTKHRLLLILTDGKPNDIDHYEGRYGIEDTKRAILESRRAGLSVFGVTVDREAQDYFPAIFGSGGYAIIDHVDRLPKVLPSLYRHLVTT